MARCPSCITSVPRPGVKSHQHIGPLLPAAAKRLLRRYLPGEGDGAGSTPPGGSGLSHHVGPTASASSRRPSPLTDATVQQLLSRSGMPVPGPAQIPQPCAAAVGPRPPIRTSRSDGSGSRGSSRFGKDWLRSRTGVWMSNSRDLALPCGSRGGAVESPPRAAPGAAAMADSCRRLPVGRAGVPCFPRARTG